MPDRPYVFVNMAATVDGKIDTVARRGARISGPADTARVDALRAGADAILVGGHTLLGEDPRLDIRNSVLVARRETAGRKSQPMKVGVVSTMGAFGAHDGLPVDSRFVGDGSTDVVVFTTIATDSRVVDELHARGATVITHDRERVDLERALTTLAQHGVERLMVEGGSTIVAALLTADCVDEIQIAIAPVIFGGDAAPTPVGGPGLGIDDAIRLSLADVDTSPDGDVIARYLVDAA
jgi:riboflavin-specific deaminase-like protein